MAKPDLGVLLKSAVKLLEALNVDVKTAPEARRQVAVWAKKYSDVKVDLLIDRAPGAGRAEYDLLLTPFGEPTIAMTICADQETPWLVSYADHWAANFVATINGQHVNIQKVQREFAFTATQFPDMMKQLVYHVLEGQAKEPEDDEITREELQEEIDLFRRRNGLEAATDALRWMERHGISRADLGHLAACSIVGRRIKNRVTQDRLESYFAAHHSDFDQITLSVVLAPTARDAISLAEKAREIGLLSSVSTELAVARNQLPQAWVTTVFARDTDERIRMASPADVLGPFESGNNWLLVQVNRREPARLEGETIEAVRNVLYESWLQGRREVASVIWYWT